jgi:hypothetical protein
VRLEGLRQLKKSSDLIGNGTRNRSASSIVPQPTTLPRAPILILLFEDCGLYNDVGVSNERSSWWNDNWEGKLKQSEKTCPCAILSTTNAI